MTSLGTEEGLQKDAGKVTLAFLPETSMQSEAEKP